MDLIVNSDALTLIYQFLTDFWEEFIYYKKNIYSLTYYLTCVYYHILGNSSYHSISRNNIYHLILGFSSYHPKGT